MIPVNRVNILADWWGIERPEESEAFLKPYIPYYTPSRPGKGGVA